MESQEKLDPASGGKAALKLCPFQKAGLCELGESCLMRHVKPTTPTASPATDQSIRTVAEVPKTTTQAVSQKKKNTSRGLDKVADIFALAAPRCSSPMTSQVTSHDEKTELSPHAKKMDSNQNFLQDLSEATSKSLCLDETTGAISKLHSNRKKVATPETENLSETNDGWGDCKRPKPPPGFFPDQTYQQQGSAKSGPAQMDDDDILPPLIPNEECHKVPGEEDVLFPHGFPGGCLDLKTAESRRAAAERPAPVNPWAIDGFRSAAEVIKDGPVHFCHECNRGGLVLKKSGKCPVCNGEFVEVQDADFTEVDRREEETPVTKQTNKIISISNSSSSVESPVERQLRIKKEFTGQNSKVAQLAKMDPQPKEPEPTDVKNVVPPSGDCDKAMVEGGHKAPSTRSLSTKPKMPLRKPREASLRPYYCYNCKTKAPFLCSNDSKCPTCKSDFVEEHDTAVTAMEFEKFLNSEEERFRRQQKAVRMAKYTCHGCNKTSLIKAGQELKCQHCDSDFIEEKVENGTWAEAASQNVEDMGESSAQPVAAPVWQQLLCHNCHCNYSLDVATEPLRCKFCQSDFVETSLTLNGSPVGDAGVAQPSDNRLEPPSDIQHSWPSQEPKQGAHEPTGGIVHERVFKTGNEFIRQVNAAATALKSDESQQLNMIENGVSNKLLKRIFIEIEGAAAKLLTKLQRRLGEDFQFEMEQCCPKPFQLVPNSKSKTGRQGDPEGPMSPQEFERKIRSHIKQITVVLFNNRQPPLTPDGDADHRADSGQIDPSFDEAINEISAALDFLEKLLNYSWQRHRVDSADLNRGGEHILRLIRASFNVRCGELRKAKQDIYIALTINSEDATPYFMRGIILKQQGKEDESTADMMKGIHLDPERAARLTDKYF